jgi:dolichyl-phosphate mannosyltransferase polypeptide 2 regulatory subunit
VQPFVDSKQAIHAYFPPRLYAIAIPTVLLILAIVVVTTFIGFTLVRTQAAKKQT